MNIFPYSVDFRINGNCNLECPFCFGPRHELLPMKTDNALKVVDLVASYGSKAIVFTGGEPLLVKDLPEILKFAKLMNLKVVLSTNGTLIHERLDEISEFVNWLAIPLDGFSSKTNALSRVGRLDHFEASLSSIQLIRSKCPHIKIKVGTVVSAINREDICKIPSIFFKDRIVPDTWKIYQVSYSSYGEDNKELLRITDQEFDSIIDQLKADKIFDKINVEIYKNSSRNKKYLFVEPNGDVVTIVHDKEQRLGNLLIDSKAVVFQLCKDYIDKDLLESNFRRTYH